MYIAVEVSDQSGAPVAQVVVDTREEAERYVTTLAEGLTYEICHYYGEPGDLPF